jgi:tetratricopeptide repeat protein
MIAVIQCAGSKRTNAGYLKTKDGTPVSFVAHPEFAPPAASCICARPDDASDTGGTWSLDLLARLLHEQGNLPGARPLYERALAIVERTFGREDPETAALLTHLARLLHEAGLCGAPAHAGIEVAVTMRILDSERRLADTTHPLHRHATHRCLRDGCGLVLHQDVVEPLKFFSAAGETRNARRHSDERSRWR